VLIQFAADIFVKTALNFTFLKAHTWKDKFCSCCSGATPIFEAVLTTDFVTSLADQVV